MKTLPEARTSSVDQDINLPCLDTHTTVKSITEELPEIPQKKLKISVGDSEEQNLSTAEGESHETETIRTCDNDVSACSGSNNGSENVPYYNLPPPLLEPRQKTGEAGAYMMPTEMLPELSITSNESDYYLECIP